MSLPFEIDISHEIPRFRAETFWTKEPETIQWINNNLQSNSKVRLFVDVGANIGIYTLYAASVSANVEILAAEPIRKSFIELRNNIDLNHWADRVKAVNVAISDTDGNGRMTRIDDRVGSSGAQLENGSKGEGVVVSVTTGDQFVIDHASSEVSALNSVMLKIDTDGNELDVLRGFNDMFAKNTISTVLVETNPLNADAIDQFLASWNLLEDIEYHKIVDHSDHRRSLNGNVERTKIYSTVF